MYYVTYNGPFEIHFPYHQMENCIVYIQFMYTYTKILKTFLRGIFDPINYNAHTSYRNNSSLSAV